MGGVLTAQLWGKTGELEKDPRDPLWMAATGDSSELRAALAAGLNPDLESPGGDPLVSIAAGRGDFGAVAALIEARANLNNCGQRGFYPLHCAVDSGNCRVIETMAKGGAKLGVEGIGGLSLLHRSVSLGNHEVTELLLNLGAPCNVADNLGWTPLHVAAHSANCEIAQLLLGHGANLDATDSLGRTPINLSADCGCYEMLSLLSIARGAECSLPTGHAAGMGVVSATPGPQGPL